MSSPGGMVLHTKLQGQVLNVLFAHNDVPSLRDFLRRNNIVLDGPASCVSGDSSIRMRYTRLSSLRGRDSPRRSFP